jgi:hypothetical protein
MVIFVFVILIEEEANRAFDAVADAKLSIITYIYKFFYVLIKYQKNNHIKYFSYNK